MTWGPFAAVLFDLDGTLVDSTEDLAAAVNHTRAALGFPPTPLARVRAYIGDGVQMLLARSIPDPALLPRALEIYKPYYAAHLLDRTRAYDGIEDALAALALRRSSASHGGRRPPPRWDEPVGAPPPCHGASRRTISGVFPASFMSGQAGLPMAVVTNKGEGFSRAILERTGLACFFGAVIGADSGHGKKPEPGPFRAALAALGVPAGAPAHGAVRALMVGDGRNDVLGARAAGLAVCGVGWGIDDPAHIRALAPDFWAERPEDLPAVVLGYSTPT